MLWERRHGKIDAQLNVDTHRISPSAAELKSITDRISKLECRLHDTFTVIFHEFSQANTRFDRLNTRMDRIDDRLNCVDARIGRPDREKEKKVYQ